MKETIPVKPSISRSSRKYLLGCCFTWRPMVPLQDRIAVLLCYAMFSEYHIRYNVQQTKKVLF